MAYIAIRARPPKLAFPTTPQKSAASIIPAVVFRVKAIPFGRKNMRNVSEQENKWQSVQLLSVYANSKFTSWWCERKWQSLKWKSRWFHPNGPAPFAQCNSQYKLTRTTKTSDVKFGSFRTSTQKTAKCVQTSTVLTRRHFALIHIYKRGTKLK